MALLEAASDLREALMPSTNVTPVLITLRVVAPALFSVCLDLQAKEHLRLPHPAALLPLD